MSLFRWRKDRASDELQKAQAEKQELKAELTQTIMQFERRRSTVTEVADNVMAFMQHKGGGN